jgi:GNAT superfamily N-acetyltransferase
MKEIELNCVVGEEIAPYLDELAGLRIEVFRDYPYLYDGSMAYERTYLQRYAASGASLFVLAWADGVLVGAATGLPLADEVDYIQAPFRAAGIAVDTVFYFGESVLRKPYRGQGIGVRFIQEREDYARRLGRFQQLAFCAVDRPADHPRRPPAYVPLDEFWRRRGFERHPELKTHFSWQDLDEAEESPKAMTFWLKSLAGEGR